MTPRGILFVVVPASRLSKTESWIGELLIPAGRPAVKLLSDAGAGKYTTDVPSRVAAELTDTFLAFPPHPDNKLLIDREVDASIADMVDWWEMHDFGVADVQKLPPRALGREIKRHLEASCLDWRTYAQAEVRKFDGPPVNLEAWLQQFSTLGLPKVGRKIAAQLRVVRTGELPHHAFAIRQADSFGIARANCYVQDDDEGGSWSEIKSLLTHGVDQGTVMSIAWDKKSGTMAFPDVAVDEFVIYEDGLWSGHEGVLRLKAIAADPPVANIVFRFGIVTDFGLMVMRQAIRSLGLSGKVRVDASASENIAFLEKDLAEDLRLGSDYSPDNYYRALHGSVRPFAFAIREDWTGAEIEFCETVGGQIATNWLKDEIGADDLKKKAALFALGAGRFASTVIFSRSVPKVCLPLLWLDGPVTYGGVAVQWRPLFVDARRVSDLSLLHML